MRLILFASILLLLTGCDNSSSNRNVITIRGNTMGTTYLVKVVTSKNTTLAEVLKKDIENTLERVNNNLSNWRTSSEVSRFNKRQETTPINVSDDLSKVIEESFYIHRLSNSRFDITLAPLIKLWGFGPKKFEQIPSSEDIQNALSNIGMTKLLVFSNSQSTLKKNHPNVTINLSAIAKGYGADEVAKSIEKHGVKNFLVEIGGELFSRGLNDKGQPWVIGIEKPEAKGRSVHKIVKISNLGIATSGNYRNYIERNGKRFSHIIDPITGRPITHNLASVTVLAPSAMRADGLATALFVLGDAEGFKVAEKNQIAAFFIIRTEKGFVEKSTSQFSALLK